jgi:hypothetical protein
MHGDPPMGRGTVQEQSNPRKAIGNANVFMRNKLNLLGFDGHVAGP